MCLSFANEQRGYVDQVARILLERSVKVFYDDFEQADLWGKDLGEHLDYIYRKAARYCVVFVSADYAGKVWTNHERKSAQARAIAENEEYLLPARFDDTDIPGLRPTVAYVDLRQVDPSTLADIIQSKLDIRSNYPANTIEDIKSPSIASAVAQAKRALSSAVLTHELHDALRQQVEQVRRLPSVAATTFEAADAGAEYELRLGELETGIETLVALVATSAYWGDEKTDRWWFNDLSRFGELPRASGLTALIKLTAAPATYLLYAGGVGAASAERWPLVGRLLSEPKATDIYSGKRRTIAALLPPSNVLSSNRGSFHLFSYIRPLFVEHLALGEAAFIEAWERFAYLLSVANMDEALVTSRGSWIDVSRIRANDTARGEYQPVPGEWLREQLEGQGREHPLLLAGFCAGDLERARAAQDAYDQRFASTAHEAAWSTLSNGGGVLPGGRWYPDETPYFNRAQ